MGISGDEGDKPGAERFLTNTYHFRYLLFISLSPFFCTAFWRTQS